jgi:DNA-binding GntR family transcriptional regulator
LDPWIHGATILGPQLTTHELTPVTATSLADEIAFRLRSDILEGVLPLGARLQQDELCTRFGVSRTPVREALRQLQALNLITLAPSRGATVRVPSRRELIEVYELRADLEGLASRLAAARWRADDLAEIRQAQDALSSALDAFLAGGEAATFDRRMHAANDAFHEGIRRVAGNGRLGAAVRDLEGFFPKDHVWQAAIEVGELEPLNRDDHDAILDALEARRPGAARRAMTAHVERAGRILIGFLDAQGFWS